MFDDFSKRSKAVRAALDLAQHKGWGEVGLSDIAAAANLGLADLRREFTCKSDILRAFQAEIDAEVLVKARVAGEGQSPRDRLFDAIMTRFEAMHMIVEGFFHSVYDRIPVEAVRETLSQAVERKLGIGD